MVIVFSIGVVTVVGLSLTVLLAMLLYLAARVDEAADPEPVILWQETESNGLKWWSDAYQNGRGRSRTDEIASASASG
jgi:hypothetical protein